MAIDEIVRMVVRMCFCVAILMKLLAEDAGMYYVERGVGINYD